MQGIYTYIPETNYVPREYSVAAILFLLFMVLLSLVPVWPSSGWHSCKKENKYKIALSVDISVLYTIICVQYVHNYLYKICT